MTTFVLQKYVAMLYVVANGYNVIIDVVNGFSVYLKRIAVWPM